MQKDRREEPPLEPVEEQDAAPPPPPPPETAERPAPGVRHKPEPDAENIVPVKHEPGTF